LNLNDSKNQMGWAVLLLAIAVILPTVCLLYFMSQAVKNEELAIRQQVVNVYTRELQKLRGTYNERWDKWRDFAQHTVQTTLSQKGHNCILFGNLLQIRLGDMRGMPRIAPFTGVLVYDSSGNIEYPVIHTEESIEYDLPDIFTQAWAFEFQNQQYPEAAEIYNKISESGYNDYIRRLAIIGHARCLQKQGKLSEALDICVKAHRDVSSGKENAELFEAVAQTKNAFIPLIVQARVFDISIRRRLYETGDPLPLHLDYYAYESAICDLWILAYDDYSALSRAMDAEMRIYLLYTFIELADTDFLRNTMRDYPDSAMRPNRIANLKDRVRKARTRLMAEELALDVAGRYPTSGFLQDWQDETLHKLDLTSNTYALGHEYLGKSYLVLVRPETIAVDMDALYEVFRDSLFDYRVVDSDYDHVAGITDPSKQMILETGLGGCYAGWKIRLYYKDDTVFEKAVKRQRVIYIWIAILTVTLMLLVTGSATKALLRQAKLNTLKNDFIATVTHELKTPLASMRVLADTLLEGNYKDQKQATEYLQLICKENRRLSGLIDNFLSFSRMERNKHAFDMAKTDPADIAAAAADAVRTKFDHENCSFTVTVDQNLAFVSADRDAMVTVLVNLLDNAYKYSYDDKQIELKVSAQDAGVSFTVTDKGIGMTAKQAKRAFDRFYQVDSSLSRRVEGAGLGLSIVKYIVDAHQGSISVKSIPGEGSTFTLKLPVVN
jgi:signal transduction histidine kinase